MARAAEPVTFAWLDASPTCEDFTADAEAVRRSISAALDALAAAGLAIVPVEPTGEMIEACYDRLDVMDGRFVAHTADGLSDAITEGDLLRKEEQK